MSSAKDEILNRVRNALKDVPEKEEPVERNYNRTSGWNQQKKVRIFAERVGEYKAKVSKVNESELPKTIAEACRREQIHRLVVPPGFSRGWLPDEPELLDDGEGALSKEELDNSHGIISTCRLAIAQTGTIVLDGGAGQGRRALSLVPDYHLCIVRADQITGIVPEAFALLEDTVIESAPPVTFISGPSATSDIELNRVEGVHGPRRLEVIIVDVA